MQCSFNSDPLPAVMALGKRRYKERRPGAVVWGALQSIAVCWRIIEAWFKTEGTTTKEENRCRIEQCTTEN